MTFTFSGPGSPNVIVSGNDSFQFGLPLSGSYSIPASLFPNDPAGAGNDAIGLYQLSTSNAFNTNPASTNATGLVVIKNY